MNTLAPTATTVPILAEVDGFPLPRRERWAIYSALIAQVDNVHVGGVWSWDADDIAAATRALAGVTDTPIGETPEQWGKSLTSRVIATCLLVPLYELDEPELTEEEWSRADALIQVMSAEFGRCTERARSEQ